MVAKVLGNTGAPIKARTIMYKAVVQAVLLYGSKIWVAMYTMMTMLEVFHHRIEIQIAGMISNKGCRGGWGWALVDAALGVKGCWPIREYMSKRQATIVEYIAGRPI